MCDVASFSQFLPGIRSIDYSESAKTLLVGTRSAEIFEVSANGQAKVLL